MRQVKDHEQTGEEILTDQKFERIEASDKNTGKTDWNPDEDLKMNKFNRRIERLEEKLGVKQGPRDILITNVDFTDGQQDPYNVQLFPALWACAIGGGPFTRLDSCSIYICRSKKLRQSREGKGVFALYQHID